MSLSKTLLFRDFPRPDLGPNIGPLPIKKLAKTSQNGVYHSQYLFSPFWQKFNEKPNKNSKVTDACKFAYICE